MLGIALPKRPTRTSYKIAPCWYAPIGALMIAICGASSLLAFPLDDIWHRIFGQDVTLWGPTHLMLIGGASLSVLGAWALHAEGDEERRAAGRPLPRWTRFREIVLAGAFLVALSTFQAEFDFGVPQFALALQPTLIMLAAGIGLVTARIRFGPGGAVAALLVYIAIRGTLTLLIGPLFGEITPTSRPTWWRRWWSRASPSPTCVASLPPSGRSPSARSRGSRSARSASPPSGSGPTSGSSTPGPPPSSPRARSPA